MYKEHAKQRILKREIETAITEAFPFIIMIAIIILFYKFI